MKKCILVILSVAILLSLAGCGGAKNASPEDLIQNFLTAVKEKDYEVSEEERNLADRQVSDCINELVKKDVEAGLQPVVKKEDKEKIHILGTHNLIFLVMIIFAVILSSSPIL